MLQDDEIGMNTSALLAAWEEAAEHLALPESVKEGG